MLQTGAMMVALGQGIAGAFTPSDALAAKLNTASSHAGAPWKPVLQMTLDIISIEPGLAQHQDASGQPCRSACVGWNR